MKAKPSKAKTSAGKPAKRVAKKPSKTLSLKTAGAKKKPAAAKLASKKPAAAKPAAKSGGKPPRKALKETRIARLAPKAAVATDKPKPTMRRIPKPASVATRRKERAHFRELLLKKRQDLMRAYAISKGDSQAELDNGTEDYVDYAVNSYAREFLLSLTELDRKHLLLVEEALTRIDRGEYGY